MVKLVRGGMNRPRGEMHLPRGRGFPRFPLQPPPMMGQQLPSRNRDHFPRPPLPYRPPLPPSSRGRPFSGPTPPSQFAHYSKHPLPLPRMGSLTPRGGLPICPDGVSYPPRPMSHHPAGPPGPFRSSFPPFGLAHKNSGQPFIRKPAPVKRIGDVNVKTKQKQKRKSKPKERSEEAEINKPWMTEKLKIEISKKHKLYHQAKETNTEEGWAKYTEQRTLVGKISNAAKLEYIGSQPDVDVEKIMFGGRGKTATNMV